MKKNRNIKTKDFVLKELEANRGEFIRGEELGKALGISRAAIWRAIKTLQDRGYDIECRTNRGYSLSVNGGILSEEGIKKYIFDDEVNITVLDEVGSTNDVIKQLAGLSAPEWTVVAARKQTGGKGRMGRTFESPADNGIYMSILLRPTISPADSVKITTLASVAVAKAIEEYGKQCEIKWVNDIYVNSKKVCGILTESGINAQNGTLDYAVLGIGLNVSEKGLSDELKEIAGGIGLIRKHDVKNKLAASIIKKLKELYGQIGSDEIYEEYRSRSLVIGKEVSFFHLGELMSGRAVDITPDYALTVETSDKKTLHLNSGEVSIKVTHAQTEE